MKVNESTFIYVSITFKITYLARLWHGQFQELYCISLEGTMAINKSLIVIENLSG